MRTAHLSRPDYPVTVDLRGKRVLVVGGGAVAERRVARLVESGAVVDLVAPQVTPEILELAGAGVIIWHAREFAPTDALVPQRAWLVHTATGVAAVDSAVAEAAAAEAIWCVRADEATASAAWTPAVGVGRGDADGIQVAVTAGGDPRRAMALRDAIVLGLETGELPSRRLREPAEPRECRVALVGGGPGAEDLITVRGRKLLAQADVVVTDRLGPTTLLAGLAPGVEVIDVGKTPGNHPVPQLEINETLVRHAKEGALVVRLKGGDPFVLGRGGEEMLHCAAHGIPVEVVPGVTSAVSVPAAAGIPVTHRGVTASFVVASAHDGPDSVLAAARHAAADATLVLLMGTTRLADTARALIAAGRSPDTPVAIIESGWTERQRTTITTLADAPAAARAAGVRPPAVVVVGDVVGVREQLLALAPAAPALV
ncbi:MAG: uroporphyrinogen-III C-methyltransferase [Tetrasphaera sp.]